MVLGEAAVPRHPTFQWGHNCDCMAPELSLGTSVLDPAQGCQEPLDKLYCLLEACPPLSPYLCLCLVLLHGLFAEGSIQGSRAKTVAAARPPQDAGTEG